MSHFISLTKDGKGLRVPVENGTAIRLTDARVWAKESMWHLLGTIHENGLRIFDKERPYGMSAYTAFDAPVFGKDAERFEFDTYAEVEAFLADGGEMIFDLDTQLHPIFVDVAGHKVMTEHAMIVNHATRQQLVGEANNARWIPDPNIIAPVRTGLTTKSGWEKFNPEGEPYTRSPHYEVVTPRKVFQMLDEVLYEETGMHMKAHSAGALGDGGSKGVWVSVPLPKWHGDVVTLIGTDVDSYMTLFNDPTGTMYVVETDIMTVCYNTWVAALSRATRRLKVDHQLGATERMREAMQGIWQQNKEGQQLVQEVVVHLAENKVEEEQVKLAAQAMFPLPGQPDRELIGVRSLDDRMKDYERNVDRALGMREAFVELFNNPREARTEFGIELGIAPQVEGTAFAAAQVGTFLQTYYPGKPDNIMRDWFKGNRLRASNSAMNALMTGGELEVDNFKSEEPEVVAVSGVGYPQSVLDAYADDIERARESETTFNVLQTNLN